MMSDKKIDPKKQKDFNKKQKNQNNLSQQKDSKELKESKDSKEQSNPSQQKETTMQNSADILIVASSQNKQSLQTSVLQPSSLQPSALQSNQLPELQQESTPIFTERLKTAIMRNNSVNDLKSPFVTPKLDVLSGGIIQSKTDYSTSGVCIPPMKTEFSLNNSRHPSPITVDTSTPNYNSKMLLAVLQNRKNQMLEGKRVLCTERVIPAEDIKRHTQGFIIVPREQWENITPGSYIIYMGYDNNYRNGGYIKYKYEKNNTRYFQIETKQGRKTNDPSYISFPVAYDEIKTLFKKIDPSAIVEINLIKKDLANKRDNIEYLNKKLAEEHQARKQVESRVEQLEKENKKIKALLKMIMNAGPK